MPKDIKNAKKTPPRPPAPSRPMVPLARPEGPPPAAPDPADEDDGVDLCVLAQGAPIALAPILEELKLGPNPACFSLFTPRGVAARLHYEEHESHRGFHHCLGDECPPCLAGQKPTDVLLIPCYDFVSRRVAILRVSTAEGPHRFWSLLRPHIGHPTTASSFFTARREGNRFFLQVAPVPKEADRGVGVIRQFIEDWKARRINIKATYPTHTADELRQIPAIRSYLELHGLMPDAPVIAMDDEWALVDEGDMAASEEGQDEASAAA